MAAVLAKLKALVSGALATKEAVLTWTVLGVAAVTGYKVLVERLPLSEVVSADYLNWAFAMAGSVVARALVWSKSSAVEEDAKRDEPRGL